MKWLIPSVMFRHPWLAAALVVATLAVACGGQGDAQGTVTADMDELNQSGQSGTATLTAQGGNTEVVVTLSSGAMTSGPVHIHSGQCGDALGAVAHPLTSFSGETSTTVLEGVSLASLLNGDRAINAHNADDGSIYTACGNLPLPSR